MHPENSEIITEQKDGIATIQLNRPNVLNAINRHMLNQLDTEVNRLHQDPSVRIVILTSSSDKAFCVGADLNHIATFTPECIRKWVIDGNRMLSRLANLRVPVIAEINGYTIGGGLEVALACDLRIADDTSSFSLPEITHGWFPGWGGTNRLPNIIGETKAKEMIFLGERIDAKNALNLGLVNRIFPAKSLAAETAKIAGSLAEKSPVAIQAAKAALSRTPLPENSFEINYEALALSTCFTTPEVKQTLQEIQNRHNERIT